jgi:hypothetical protein
LCARIEESIGLDRGSVRKVDGDRDEETVTRKCGPARRGRRSEDVA